ncbi:MAG: type II secretion system protein [Opitutaceae bacterium]|nr:type II secretion system protein [Opitutaceae bacterium]
MELLIVIAVIGLLAGMLLPSLSAARQAANHARTRVRFAQWTAACEAFRREYGYYPVLDASGLVNPPGQSADPAEVHVFHDVLAGRRRDGAPLPASAAGADPLQPSAQNRKRIAFYRFPDSEWVDGLIADASGQTGIAVLVDRDLDGFIRPGSDFAALPSLGGVVPGAFPPGGVRGGVAFYTLKPGAGSAAPEFLCSWQ